MTRPENYPSELLDEMSAIEAKLRSGLQQSSACIAEAQKILESYLIPGGPDRTNTISALLGVLDNRVLVEHQGEWLALLSDAAP